MSKKWQTTVYLPADMREDVKGHKLDLSRMLTEQIEFILGGQCNTGTEMPTVKKVKAMQVIRDRVPAIIAERYDADRLMKYLPESDRHGDYEERMMMFVRDVQRTLGLDGHMSEILVFTRDHLSTLGTPT